MSDTTDTCPCCGGPVVRLPNCRWCGMVIATVGESAERLSGEGDGEKEYTVSELHATFGGVGLHDYRFARHGGAVGFTWEADLYCYDCTRERFGEPEDPVSPWLDVEDAEGNPVGAVFPFDEFDYEPRCGSCNEPIDAATIEEDN